MLDDHAGPRSGLAWPDLRDGGTAVESPGVVAAPTGLARPTSRPGARPGAPRQGQPSLGELVERRLTDVRGALDAYMTESSGVAEALHPVAGRLWSDLAEQIGGKLVRPRLVLTAYHGLLDGEGPASDGVPPLASESGGVAAVAAAQELLHTAMLVHDDLLDHDEQRRGRPNLAGMQRARDRDSGRDPAASDDRVQAAAVLGGDLAISAAVEIVLRAPLAPAIQTELVSSSSARSIRPSRASCSTSSARRRARSRSTPSASHG
ncbi:hypothetical protein GCM10025865_08460 [Paraoerskovia sediminicola]|uniref:Polyprenyl synthetase n=1 Tax=Paraoerskovia sediminicola TaxID=1138587 RepID=A0ABN6X9V2_9CELL|nr:polyprenyl synthetase family protein [Paraoerskovia sediminicola]BDZ41547.1 hypothetical protein GCM10025865_08460 [Paraoerskovia sediminicola]